MTDSIKNRWRHVRLSSVGWLCFDAPPHLRWDWVNIQEPGRVRMQLVSPRGVWWDFKINGGAWMRKRTARTE
jgi:hypothetical protein